MSDATSWNQRLLMVTVHPLQLLRQHAFPSMFIEELRAGVDRARRRHRHAELFRARHSLIDRDRKLNSELRRDGLTFHHEIANEATCFWMTDQFLERPSSQRADRVEGDVAEQLDPDFMAKTWRHRTTEASLDQRLRDRLDALGLGTVRLAEADSVPLSVMNNARLRDIRGEVRERSHDTTRLWKYHHGIPFCVLSSIVLS